MWLDEPMGSASLQTTLPFSEPWLGGVRFVEGDVVAKLQADFAHCLWVNVALQPRRPLSYQVEEQFDTALALQGDALDEDPRGLDFAASIACMLLRAQKSGFHHVAISFHNLTKFAQGALAPDDASALGHLARIAQDGAIALYLRHEDASLPAYVSTIALSDALLPEGAALDTGRDPIAEIGETIGIERAGLWARQLAQAKGPQPLSSLEKLLTEAYLPLASAVALGTVDARMRDACEDFREHFIRNYTDAFSTFGAAAKRPRMLCDLPDWVARAARLHGARHTHFLYVSKLRWDLGQLLRTRLEQKLVGKGRIADQTVLWSALPTTTSRQLDVLARGLEALRAPVDDEAWSEPVRGRTAETIRRTKVGVRDIHKLDIVDTRLEGARNRVMPALVDIAAELADLIGRYVDALPNRSLVAIFGDHGFAFDRNGAAISGGASPEEVIVPALLVLVGDVH